MQVHDRHRIVIATVGSLGDLHPAIALALGLQARGHTVSLATSEIYRHKIESTGLGFHPIRPDMEEVDPALVDRMMDSKTGTEAVFREFLIPAIRDSYTDLIHATREADVLISSDVALAAPIVAQKTHIPWISYCLSPASLLSLQDPPVLPGFVRLPKMPWLAQWANRLMKQLAIANTASWAKPIQQLRQELGLPPGKHFLIEEKYSAQLVLAPFSPIFGVPQPDWVPQVRVTGFAFYDRLLPEQGLSPELTDFLAAGAPPIVFTLGSAVVSRAGNFYTESLEAAKTLGYRAIFLVGQEDYAYLPASLPEGMIAVDYAPYSELFPRAAAIVHQGGVGTTAQALRSGVPMLVVPYAFDQPDNAMRAVRLGVGRQLQRSDYRRDRVITQLRALLSDPTYKERSQWVKSKIDAEDGVKQACDAIEQQLNAQS